MNIDCVQNSRFGIEFMIEIQIFRIFNLTKDIDPKPIVKRFNL